MRPKATVNDETRRKKLNVRGDKGTARNAHQFAQSNSHLNQPAKKPANKSSTPNTARRRVLKH